MRKSIILDGCKLALVIWDDSWRSHAEDIPPDAEVGCRSLRHTVGWLHTKTRDEVVLMMTADPAQPGNPCLTFTNPWRIPRGMVKRIIPLSPAAAPLRKPKSRGMAPQAASEAPAGSPLPRVNHAPNSQPPSQLAIPFPDDGAAA